MRREEQTTVGQPAPCCGRPEDTQGTEEDQGRDGGTIKIVLYNAGIVLRARWSSGGSMGKPTSNDGHSTAETELK